MKHFGGEYSQETRLISILISLLYIFSIVGIVAGLIALLVLGFRNVMYSSFDEVLSTNNNAILKPKADFRDYRFITLKNGLEVVLIYDPLTVSSAASLSVGVGANNDPSALQGLAHFCEHMLFLGSKKYPLGDDYFKTVTGNNGHFNAYTDREITNFFFDIHYFSFETALDIFSRFFIDPIFTNEKLSKEVNSVNSEYEKNLILDKRKRSQVMAFLAEKNHPFNRFTTGNIESLVKSAERNNLNLRMELLKFHDKFYIADKMKLVVYSNDQLDDLEDMVVEKFSSIKSSERYENNRKKKNLLKSLKKSRFNSTSIGANIFRSPFSNSTIGCFIQFASVSAENELMLNFIQKPLSSAHIYQANPFFYFHTLLESKEDNSLIDILKKRHLVHKLIVTNEKDYKEWSALAMTLSLSKKGIENIGEVLSIVENYFMHLKANLINEKNYLYLKKIASLNFEFQDIHHAKLYEFVSKQSAKIHKYPVEYILDDIHFVYPWTNETYSTLLNYAKGLTLDNAIIFFPYKHSISSYEFTKEGSVYTEYEPWYRTNFTFSKLDMKRINSYNSSINEESLKSHYHLQMVQEEKISQVIGTSRKCDTDCLDELKDFQNTEPILLNKTNSFEIWYKYQKTLDFQKVNVIIQLTFDSFDNQNQQVYLQFLEMLMKKKMKILNSKLKLISSSITTSKNSYGIKVQYSTFAAHVGFITKELVDKLQILFDKVEKIKDFPNLAQEVLEKVKKDYNAQPWSLSYEYLKRGIFTNYLTSEEYLELIKNATEKEFYKFLKKFKKDYNIKLLIMGEITQEDSLAVLSIMKPLLRTTSPLKHDLKNSNKLPIMSKSSGNYLIRAQYHHQTNKNNVMQRCYKIGKLNDKDEIMIKIFEGIIGNIVFRELRINKQFGYVAKSKVETFNSILFYCLYVQGSSQLPHIIDDAAHELIEIKVNRLLEDLSEYDLKLAKKKNIDTIFSGRYTLSKVANMYFNSILERETSFRNFLAMENYSKSIFKNDLLSFYKRIFINEKNLRVTVYMYSKSIPQDKMMLTAKTENYEDLVLNLNKLK